MNKERIQQPPQEDERRRKIETDEGVALTPKEARERKKARKENPNWWREQK